MSASRFQFRRANASAWTSANPTLAAGELGYELDTGKFKIGDGNTAWTSLKYFEKGSVQTFNTTGASNNVSLDVSTSIFKYVGAGTATITGFAVNSTTPVDQTMLLIVNASSSVLTLAHNSSSSTLAYRFSLPNSIDMTLAPNESVRFYYDASSWKAVRVGMTDGISTFLSTPSSANLRAAVTDETGTGFLVFSSSPTLTSPVLGAATATSINGVTIPQDAVLVSSAGPSIFGTVQTPYTTTGTSNNVSLDATTSIFRYTGAGNAVINGFSAAGATPVAGRFMLLQNATSAYTLTLNHDNSGSTAAYRFYLPNGGSLVLLPQQSMMIVYDGVVSRWRVNAHITSSIATQIKWGLV